MPYVSLGKIKGTEGTEEELYLEQRRDGLDKLLGSQSKEEEENE